MIECTIMTPEEFFEYQKNSRFSYNFVDTNGVTVVKLCGDPVVHAKTGKPIVVSKGLHGALSKP